MRIDRWVALLDIGPNGDRIGRPKIQTSEIEFVPITLAAQCTLTESEARNRSA